MPAGRDFTAAAVAPDTAGPRGRETVEGKGVADEAREFAAASGAVPDSR